MPAFIDLTGKRFGRLVVISRAETKTTKGGNKLHRWSCQCDCGNKKDIYANHLRSRRIISCGCYRDGGYWSREFIDLAGKRVGKLTVLRRAENQPDGRGGNKTMWVAVCDCSPHIERIVGGSRLRGKGKHLTNSCGCFQKEQTSKAARRAPYGVRYRHLVYYANKRGIPVELTLKQYQEIASQQPSCHYCGLAIKWPEHQTGGSSAGHNIDRKNNDLGYTVGNVVPCCAGCNESKMCRPYEEWVVIGNAIRLYRERNRECW
jgi:hypothetical protein